jgi:hypothetical protein
MEVTLTAKHAVKVLELRAHIHVRQKLEMQKSDYCINGKATEILKRFNNCDMQMLAA